MLGQVMPGKRVTSLYDTQKVYGERIKAIRAEGPPVVQAQVDAVTISSVAVFSYAAHRKTKDDRAPATYSNPRVDNNGRR